MNCRRFEAQLDAYLRFREGGETFPQREAAELHLHQCTVCSALIEVLVAPQPGPDLVPFARALAASERLLPQLAAIDPGPEFTQAVLRRTRVFALRRRFARWWRRQLERPQFAGEFAYASTLAVVLLVGTPMSPGAGLPTRLIGWVQDSNAQASDWLSAGATAPIRVLDKGTTVGAELGSTVSLRGESVSVVLDRLGEHGKDLAQSAWERDWEALRPLLQQIHCDMRLLWDAASGEIEAKTDDLRC